MTKVYKIFVSENPQTRKFSFESVSKKLPNYEHCLFQDNPKKASIRVFRNHPEKIHSIKIRITIIVPMNAVAICKKIQFENNENLPLEWIGYANSSLTIPINSIKMKDGPHHLSIIIAPTVEIKALDFLHSMELGRRLALHFDLSREREHSAGVICEGLSHSISIIPK